MVNFDTKRNTKKSSNHRTKVPIVNWSVGIVLGDHMSHSLTF